MKRALGVLGCLLLLAGCGADEAPAAREPTDTSAPAPSTTAPSTPSTTPPATDSGGSASGTRVITADSEYGAMLYDASGQPIYLFTRETAERPACYDDCADDWPPVLTEGEPRAAKGVRAGLLGSTERSDGRMQVTYAGHPLYYYAHEGKYEVLCHDVEEYGGTWLVVQPDGTPAPA